MTPRALLPFLGAIGMALAGTSWGQRAPNWRIYRIADGLPEIACGAVVVSAQGKVLCRALHEPVVTELDGYTLVNIQLSSPGRSRVYQSPGGQLWTVVPGGLQELRDGKWILHDVPEITGAFTAGTVTRPAEPVPLY